MVKRLLRPIAFVAIINLLFLFFAESAARLLLWTVSSDSKALAYGLDPDNLVHVQDLSEFQISFYRLDAGRRGNAATTRPTADRFESLAFAFGGSTTAGFNCSSTASSWPAELSALSPSLRVANFGRDGTNSGFAYRALAGALSNQRPDIVFWANRVNETDIITHGPNRNAERLAKVFPDLVSRRNENALYFGHHHRARRASGRAPSRNR